MILDKIFSKCVYKKPLISTIVDGIKNTNKIKVYEELDDLLAINRKEDTSTDK